MPSLSKYHQNKISYTLLFVILFTGTFLRIYGLKNQSLHFDELFSLWISSSENIEELFFRIIGDTHPPAYQLILFAFIKLFGNSEVILRMPSAIMGSISILGTFLVGKHLYSEKVGLVGAAFFAVSWTPIYFSQEARSGMMMVFVTLFAVYFWLKMIKSLIKKDNVPTIITVSYFILAIVAWYTHYFALFFIILLGIFSLIILRQNQSQLIYIKKLYGALFLAYIPWIPSLIDQFINRRHWVSWIETPNLKTLVEIFQFLLYSPFSDYLYFGILGIILIFISQRLITMVNSFVNFRNITNSHNYNNPMSSDLLIILWITIPIFSAYIFSLLYQPILVDRYLLFLLPALYLLLARALIEFPINNFFLRYSFSFSIVIILLFNLTYKWNYYTTVLKEPTRDVAIYIDENNYNNSIVITYGQGIAPISFDYYFNKIGSSNNLDLHLYNYNDNELLINDLIYKTLKTKGANYIWYITQSFSRGIPGEVEFLDYLKSNYKLVFQKTFPSRGTGFLLFVFEYY